MILYLIVLAVVLVINWFLAEEFYSAACDKGYSERKYFWIAFLLGLPGYLLIIALPNPVAAIGSDEQAEPKAATVENAWVCDSCNTENSTNYAICKKCGAYRSRC